MTIRFVLDESSWSRVADAEHLQAAVESLMERLDVAQERLELVAKHDDFYESDVCGKAKLFSVLFEQECPIRLERDLAERLRLSLDRCDAVDDTELVAYDAAFGEAIQLAPGVAWAHAQAGIRRAVAVLPLPCNDTIHGKIDVKVGDVVRSLHFVTTEREHREFFRDAIDLEDMDHDGIRAVAGSAFPDLDWVETAWHDLQAHKKCFFGERRRVLVSHLAVLDDHGAKLFHAHLGGEGVDKQLSALGVDASSENSKARSYKPSIDDRTRPYAGSHHVFWWHTKITWNEGRIHFLHVPRSPMSQRPECGHIVIGLFKDHCVLPN